MVDIVDALRDCTEHPAHRAWRCRAADEIERLRALIADAKARFDDIAAASEGLDQ